MVKIPSALKWMLTRRARLMGERQRLESHLPSLVARLESEIAAMERRLTSCRQRLAIARQYGPERLKALDVDLAAIDVSIRLYGVEVDPSKLSPIRGQYKGWAMDYGQMTRLILRALSEAGGAELTTTEVALILSSQADMAMPDNEFQDFRIRVRRRMRRLAAIGAIRRVHVANTSLEGRWAAASQVSGHASRDGRRWGHRWARTRPTPVLEYWTARIRQRGAPA